MDEIEPYTVDTSNLEFDPDELRRKYLAEKNKRLRDDGFSQYEPTTGKYARFAIDHYVEPGFERDPLRDEVEVLIIGGGLLASNASGECNNLFFSIIINLS